MSSPLMHDHLLTRHFLRRFLENDLISPNADRHETLSVIGAALVTLGLFGTALLSLKFLFQPFQSPGRTEILALDDRFLYIGWSMIVMALVAVAIWDGLALDARDESILGPLPVRRTAIVRAKLTAVALVAAGFAMALNLAPAVLYPLLMASRLSIGLTDLTRLVVVHATITTAAGAFGFLTIAAVRELLRTLVGVAVFNRIAAGIQALFVVCLLTAFFLLPGVSSGIAASWRARTTTVYTAPAVWFLGLHETLAGRAIDGLPRPDLPAGLREEEDAATTLYRSVTPRFGDAAVLALIALAASGLIGISGFAWNNRRSRIFDGACTSRGRSRTRTILARLVQYLLVRRPVAQGGFVFTLKTLQRSAAHRIAIAASLAAGAAAAAVALGGLTVRSYDATSVDVGLLAAQPLILAGVLGGFRHVVRVPAELRANWIFRVSWSEDHRLFLLGVKRAAMIGLVLPILVALLPLHLFVLGPRAAAMHGLCGWLWALVLLNGLFVGLHQVPFVSGYEPTGNLKALAPIAVLGYLVTTYGLAFAERLALRTTEGMLLLLAVLGVLVVSARLAELWHGQQPLGLPWDEPAETAAQPLHLSG